MATAWYPKEASTSPPERSRRRNHHHRYGQPVKTAWDTDGSMDSTYTRYPSPERRPRSPDKNASPPRQYRSMSYGRHHHHDGHEDDDESEDSDDDDDDDNRNNDGTRHRRSTGHGRDGRGKWRGSRVEEERRRKPRRVVERRQDADRSSSSLRSMSSWLRRLGLYDEDDDGADRARRNNSEWQRRQQSRYRHHNHQQRRRGHRSPYLGRASSVHVRSRSRTPTPSPSPSLSPSRSPPSRRRPGTPCPEHAAVVVAKHEDILRRRGRGMSRDRDTAYDDRYHHRQKTTQPPSQRSQSLPDRSGSRSRHRRYPSQQRGPPSSSSALSSSSSSPSSAWEAAARNALRAGTLAALSNHGAPGSWLGNKGTRVATAALGAALVDTYMGHKHPESVNGLRHTAMRQAAEYAISNIVAQPIMQRAARHRTRR